MDNTTTYREAVKQAIRKAMTEDERVFLMGEDVGRYGGCFAVSMGLQEEFGTQRIIDTPLSESAFTGAGIGAALNGMRPIVEINVIPVGSESKRLDLMVLLPSHLPRLSLQSDNLPFLRLEQPTLGPLHRTILLVPAYHQLRIIIRRVH